MKTRTAVQWQQLLTAGLSFAGSNPVDVCDDDAGINTTGSCWDTTDGFTIWSV
jgi:hypothetical protein